MTKVNFAEADVVPRVPNWDWPWDGEEVPPGLVGAKILFFGTMDLDRQLEGGGLVIDFIPEGKSTPERLVFSFNDRAMWVEDRIEGRSLSKPDSPSETLSSTPSPDR